MAIQLGTAAVGAGMSYLQGKQMEKQAMDKINQFKWQDLTSPYKNLQVSTLGADLQREENARAAATATQALRGAGARGIAQVGDVVSGTNRLNREVAADLDQQQKAIDMATAEDEARIRAMHEQRQTDELAGYSNLANVGMGMKYQGINQFVNTLGSAGAQYAAATAEGQDPSKASTILGFGKSVPYWERTNPNVFRNIQTNNPIPSTIGYKPNTTI